MRSEKYIVIMRKDVKVWGSRGSWIIKMINVKLNNVKKTARYYFVENIIFLNEWKNEKV